MRAKPTWRPRGLHAKKWREASQERGFQNLLPQPPPKREKALWKKDETAELPETRKL
jgi:hypothetical protein